MSNFIMAIDAGHGVNGDPGAVHRTSGRRECDDTFRLATAIHEEAKRRGIGAVMTRTLANSPAIDRAGTAIRAGAGAFICIHRNAFNGAAKGFETWTAANFSAKTGQLANAIQNKCVAAGVLANRGVKRDTGNAFPLIASVEKAGIPAVLVEYGFVDNTEDNAVFDKNFNDYVKATVDAVVETFQLDQPAAPAVGGGEAPTGVPPTAGFQVYTVRVTTDALNIRKGAGTNYAVAGVIRDRGVYTIVEESNGTGANKWGKLKSGAGWIALDWTKRV